MQQVYNVHTINGVMGLDKCIAQRIVTHLFVVYSH
jgi:hypothetical protein